MWDGGEEKPKSTFHGRKNLKILLPYLSKPGQPTSLPSPKIHMSKSSTVYVIQRPKPRTDGWSPDLSGAGIYGKLSFVFDPEDRAYVDPVAAIAKADAMLKDFDSKHDYLLWAQFGDPATMWTVISLLTLKGHTRLQYLYWSRKRKDQPADGYYIPIIIDLSQLPYAHKTKIQKVKPLALSVEEAAIRAKTAT